MKFEDAAAENLGTWAKGTVFLAAVSGGADSTAMLAALIPLSKKQGYQVHCLHVDHGIRSAQERRGDIQGVRGLCKSLEVPCHIKTIAPGKIAETAKASGLGIEGTARIFRRQAWNREARRIGAERILVAHTQEDLLETVLMRFLRGSGPAGLAAMPLERGRIVRPLLTLNRAAVLDYLQTKGISFRTDSTNGDLRYLRNRIRHKLVPCLDDLFPYWRKTVLALGETQGLTAEFLSAEAAQRIPWEGVRELCTPEDSFFSQPLIVREEALFQAADRIARGSRLDPDGVALGEKAPRRKTLRLFAQSPEGAARDAGPIRLQRRNAQIIAASGLKKPYAQGFTLLITKPGAYTVRGLRIVCQVPVIPAPLLPLGIPVKLGGNQGFFAALPLAVRDSPHRSKGLDRIHYLGYTDIITAEDPKGPAACIFRDKKDTVILLCREEKGAYEGAPLSFFIVSGGIDV